MSTETETPMVKGQAIRESPLGLDLDDGQCEKLASVCSLLGLSAGSMLLEEGHADEALYVIVSGSLEVVKPTGGGSTVSLGYLRPGDVAGIMGFVDGVKHSAAIRADSRCELIALTRPDLESLLASDPDLVYQVMRSIVRSAHRILGRMNNQFVEMSNYISQQHGRY
jgi:CRP-like cAMP-binding protein